MGLVALQCESPLAWPAFPQGQALAFRDGRGSRGLTSGRWARLPYPLRSPMKLREKRPMGRGLQGVSTREWSEFKHHANVDCGQVSLVSDLVLFCKMGSAVPEGHCECVTTDMKALGN